MVPKGISTFIEVRSSLVGGEGIVGLSITVIGCNAGIFRLINWGLRVFKIR